MADSVQSQNLSACKLLAAQIELVWAAGFFDGEGNCRFRLDKVGTNRNRSRAYGSFVLQIGQTQREVLDRFHVAVGCGKVYGPYAKQNGSKNPTTYYAFHAIAATGLRAFEQIRPYLSTIKREQGDIAAAKFKELCARPRLGNGHLRKKELAAMASIE